MRPSLRVLAVPAVLSLMVGLLSLGQAATASMRSIPRNYDVSHRPGNEAEDAIAINPTNPKNIVAMSTLSDAPAGLFVGVTFDGGKTWDRRVIGGPRDQELGDICCDEQLAWDEFGNLWMTYLHNINPDTEIALSTDGGLSFTKVASIPPVKPKGSKAPKDAESKTKGGNHFNDQPSIAVGDGSVWVSYEESGTV